MSHITYSMLLIGSASVAFLMRLPFLNLPLDRDYGLYTYMADRWLKKRELPTYVHHTLMAPGRIFVSAFALKVFGRTPRAIQTFVALWHAVTAAALFILVERLFGLPVAVVTTVCFSIFTNLKVLMTHYANTEHLLNLPAVLCMICLAALGDHLNTSYLIVPGVVCGLAIICKQPAFINLGLPATVFLFIMGVSPVYIGLFWVGVFVPIAMLLLYYLSIGMSARHFFLWPGQILWVLNWLSKGEFKQRSDEVQPTLTEHRRQRTLEVLGELMPLLIAAAAVILSVPFAPRNPALVLMTVWALFTVVGLIASKEYIPYHFICLVPPFSVLAGYGLVRAVAGGMPPMATAGALVAFLLPLAITVTRNVKYYANGGRNILASDNDLVLGSFGKRIGEHLKERTEPDDFIYVWGWEPEVYFFAERRCASRLLTSAYPDLILRKHRLDTPEGIDAINTIMEGLETNKPKFIVIMWPVLDYAEFSDFVARHYVAVEKFEGEFPVFKLKTPIPAADRSQTPGETPADMTSIVVVTHNSAQDIPRCLESIRAHTHGSFEVIIVDNHSTDGTQDYLRGSTDCRVILNEDNRGFAQAANQGIKLAKGEYVVLLNPDTVVTESWNAHMMAHFTDGVGAVGPVSNYVAGLQKFELYFSDTSGRDSLDMATLARHLYEQNRGDSLETKLLIGFCLMLRRDVIDKVGLLDEDLFLGNEDLEYSWRLRRNGYRLAVATDTFIFHEGQTSFNTEPKEKTERLVQESTDKLYAKLEEFYGEGQVPAPRDLWGITWFRPSKLRRDTDQGKPGRRESAEKKCSIVIVTCNQLEYTKKCVDSIRKHTRRNYELIFVDNGSKDGTVEFLRSVAGAKVVTNPENLGFPKGCNKGIEAADGEYVLLLNNDVVVTEGWLEGLIECIESDPEVGMVGPCSNWVSGLQLDREAQYTGLDEMHRYAREFRRRNLGKRMEYRRLVGFCLLIKREVVDQIGLMDERFGLGNFEDDDYCLRALQAGYKLLIVQDVFVHHFGNRTFVGNGVDFAGQMQRNEKLFLQKWGLESVQGAPAVNRSAHAMPVLELVKEADQRIAAQDYDGAIELYLEAIEKDCEYPEPYRKLGTLLYEAGEYEEAAVLLDKYADLKPRAEQAILDAAGAHFKAEDYVKSRQRLELAMSYTGAHASERSQILKALGDCHRKLESTDEAVATYQEALTLEPDNCEMIYALGLCHQEKGETDRACDYFHEAAKNSPDYAEPHNSIGMVAWTSGDKQEALSHFRTALDIDGGNRDALSNFVTAACEMQRLDEAEEVLRSLLEKNPQDVDLLVLLRDFYDSQGKHDEATMILDQAARLAQASEPAAEKARAGTACHKDDGCSGQCHSDHVQVQDFPEHNELHDRVKVTGGI